jgi:hypothetical protein
MSRDEQRVPSTDLRPQTGRAARHQLNPFVISITRDMEHQITGVVAQLMASPLAPLATKFGRGPTRRERLAERV